MEVTFGISTEMSEVHLLKAYFPIEVTFGMLTEVKPLQPLNAYSSTEVILLKSI